MTVIVGKNRKDIIKALKKLGEVVVIAKADVIYAFKKGFFPNQTTEQIMEEIKKNPKDYKYYQIGDIKITEISETKEETKETCDHLLDYEETHCTICNKPVWLFDNEHVLERLDNMEKVLRDIGKPLISALTILQAPDDRITDIEKALKKLDIGKKIAIGEDLMKRIMSHKSVPMDKSKYQGYVDTVFSREEHKWKNDPDRKPKTEKKEKGVLELELNAIRIYPRVSGGEQSVKVDSSKAIVKDEVNPRIRTDSKPPKPKFIEGNCIYKMECENVSETCHLECGRYHKFDLREFIDNAYDLAQPKTEPEKSEHMWSHLTDVSYCYICNQFAHHVGYDSECIIEERVKKEAESCWGEKVHKCKSCDLVAHDQSDKSRLVCLHESFRPESPIITKEFICPKGLIITRMGTGNIKDQKEFKEKVKWENKKEQKD